MSTITREHVPWRYRVFAITWLGYAGFYLCRKNFAVAKNALDDTFGFTNMQLSYVWTGYLAMYALGQFVNGFLGDVKGPRFMVTLGLCTSAAMNFFCGFGETIGLFAILMGINGYAQATGWPGLVKCMGNWFIIRERGRVMGWWGTCFAVGGMIATLYATFLFSTYWEMIAHVPLSEIEDSQIQQYPEAVAQAWKIIFWGPAATLLLIALLFLILVRNRPADVGLNTLDEFDGLEDHRDEDVKAETARVLSQEEEKAEFRVALKNVFSSRTVWIYCAVYFCMKFIRYGMLSWLPKYAKDELAYDFSSAGYLSVGFELAAPLGVLFCGYVSDKLFNARRTPICSIMLACLFIACLAQAKIAYWSMGWYFLGLCAIGFTIFGPDALMSGPAAQDFGSARAAGMCAGLINGVGSIGAMLQEPLIGWATTTYKETAWSWLFYVFAGLALIATVAITFTWNDIPRLHKERQAQT